jgi:hypothetical protein
VTRNRILLWLIGASLLGTTPAVAQTPPPPGSGTVLGVFDSAGGGCTVGVTPNASVGLGERITVRNESSGVATVYQRDGFWTIALGVGVEKNVRVFGAGTYLSACILGQWKAPLKARPKAPGSPPGDSFKVTWSVDAAPATFRYTVQYRIGQGVWRAWKSGTSLHSATFSGSNGKTYFFRARTIRSGGAKSDWSPARRVVT